MTEFLDLKAFYRNGKVYMTWQIPVNVPGTFHVFPCTGRDDSLQLDKDCHQIKRLSDHKSGYSFEFRSSTGADVKRVSFCVYLSDSSAVPDMRDLRPMKKCFVSVIIGRADVMYDIRKNICDNEMVRYQIWTKSSAEIENGILAYSYYFNGKEISVEFPGKITRNLTEYPPIYLLSTAEPVIGIVGRGSSDVSVFQKKIPFWQRISKSVKFGDQV